MWYYGFDANKICDNLIALKGEIMSIYRIKKHNFKYFAVIAVISIFFAISASYCDIRKNNRKITIKTDQNKVKIDNTDMCVYIPKYNIIMCKSGKCFKNISKIVGSSTGTPPWLMYKNYIGYYLPESNKYAKLPGEARRVIFCDGPCDVIDKK